MKKDTKALRNSNSLFFILICIILIAVTIVVGVFLSINSEKSLKTAIWDHMESVATTAAEFVDGEDIKVFTKDDSPKLRENGSREDDGSLLNQKIEKILLQVKNSQDDMHISYIYIVRKQENKFVFIVDPDTNTPAPYGKEVVSTPSQEIAWNGIPKVDEEMYQDEWGKYYSAWSPIFDDESRVVGLVGVDFDAEQVATQTKYNTRMIIIGSVVTLAVSIVAFSLFTVNFRRRFQNLDDEITELSTNLNTIFDEIDGIEEEKKVEEDYSGLDHMAYVHKKTIDMTQRLREHTEYMKLQANVDFMTKTGNNRAYSNEKERIGNEIEQGTANFTVAVFDINNLKQVNDNYGHECGDDLIVATASAIKKIFMNYSIFRIGGDEFTVIIPTHSVKVVDSLFKAFDEEINSYNSKISDNTPILSVSKGYSIFNSNNDKEYKEVFSRADQNMYAEKAEYHKNNQ